MPQADHSHHLKELHDFFANPDICRNSFRLLIHFSIRLAAVGHTADVLEIVQRTADPSAFRPLADGLRHHLGQPLRSRGPSRKLALQIAAKISDEIAAHNDTLSVA